MDRRITASNHYIHTHRTINERPVMEFKEVVEDRYSCKKFNGEPVAEKALKAILEAGRVAPTAKNLQEQHVYDGAIAREAALIDEAYPLSLRRHHGACRGLQQGKRFHLSWRNARLRHRRRHHCGYAHVARRKERWRRQLLGELLQPRGSSRKTRASENEEVLMMLDLGYAAEDGKPLPNHASRKPLNDTVTYL